MLTGDGGSLRNTWEELCVQVQGQHSWAWGSYLDTVTSLVEKACHGLSRLEGQAVWLQTQQGEDWGIGERDQAEDPPVYMPDVFNHIMKRVLADASDWSNARIEKYLQQEHD